MQLSFKFKNQSDLNDKYWTKETIGQRSILGSCWTSQETPYKEGGVDKNDAFWEKIIRQKFILEFFAWL